ncbi:MAG TPA: CusA/CzcA family heavy metal efflux RND transporter [Rhodocyclaceae bacterium]
MLDRLITFAIQQRLFVLVMVLAVAGFGVRAFLNLPIEAFPDVQDVQVQVVTQFPGQSPEEVERSISVPIERELSGVPHMTQLRSVSITGLSVVTLTFAEGTEDRFARTQVLEKLQNVTLPTGIQPQLAPLTTAVGEIYRYVLDAPKEMSAADIRAVQDWAIRPELRRVSGVADVNSFGGAIKEYQVNVRPEALKKFGLTLDQVSQALAANGANAGGGLMTRGPESFVVRTQGLYQSLDDITAVGISARNGLSVSVGDVATVSVGEKPLSGIVAFNDRDSVVEGIVVMTKGENPAKVIAALKERVAYLNGGNHLPPGVSIHPIYDRTELIQHTVHTVAENLLVGALLVVAILVIFLRSWPASLIVAAIIPLTLLFAFIMMDLRGVSANLISLGAVDFGIIIDSAVVMVEALMVKLALHQADHPGQGWRLHTLKHTAVELSRPILFSKAIIILAFVPIFTFQRVEGRIFSPVAFTLSFALLGAVLLTLLLVPALLSFGVQRYDLRERHAEWLQRLQERYRALLHDLLAHPRKAFVRSAAVLGVALALMTVIGSEFLPRLDEGNIWLTISLPPATALEQSKEVERAVRSVLLKAPEIRQVISQVGRPDDGTDPKGPNNIEILADLKPHSEWRYGDKEQLVEALSNELKAIPGLPTNFSQVIEDNVEEALSGVKGEIAVKIFGPDLEVLEDKADQVAEILASIRGAADVAAIHIGGQTELVISPDRRRIARYGLNVADVNNVVQTALAGNAVSSFFEGERRFDITLRLAAASRRSVSDIAALQVPLPNSNATLDLGELARIETKQGASRIAREAGGRAISIKSNLLGRDQGSFVQEAQKAVAQQVVLPKGYFISWGGQFENQQRAMKRLAVIVPASLLAIFALLFWAFRSVSRSLMIIAITPFTLVGGLAGLFLAGLHLSVSAAVGFIAVAGISVQNGVIMLEEIVDLLRRGHNLAESIIEGAVRRLRPIMMTALMAGLGLLPAALSHGIGSETQRPFAVVIVGGILSATFFTLTLLPVLFSKTQGTGGVPLSGEDPEE